MDTIHEALIEKQIQQNDYIIRQNNEIIRLLAYIAEEPENEEELSEDEYEEQTKENEQNDERNQEKGRTSTGKRIQPRQEE